MASAPLGVDVVGWRRGRATSSARTRAKLDWTPEQPGLIADIDHPAYFA
jgi:hypothetical protein